MGTKAADAVQETPEELEARLAQEAIDAGETFDGQEDDDDASGADTLNTVATTPPGDAAPAKTDIDPETLAAIAGDDKPKTVPHSRFNEVNEEAKANRKRVLELEEELARANGKAGTAAAPTKEAPKVEAYDYDAAEELYSAAILDGDTTKARAIRAEIRTNERAEAIAEAEVVADRRYAANRQQDEQKRAELERDLAVAKAYVAFPFLDSNSETKNQDAIDEVLALTNFYSGKGKSIGEALSTAVAKIGPRYAPAAVVEPGDKALEIPKPDLEKALKRDAQIPAKPEGLGARAAKLDVSKMTPKQMKELSPEDEARLAGDVI